MDRRDCCESKGGEKRTEEDGRGKEGTKRSEREEGSDVYEDGRSPPLIYGRSPLNEIPLSTVRLQ